MKNKKELFYENKIKKWLNKKNHNKLKNITKNSVMALVLSTGIATESQWFFSDNNSDRKIYWNSSDVVLNDMWSSKNNSYNNQNLRTNNYQKVEKIHKEPKLTNEEYKKNKLREKFDSRSWEDIIYSRANNTTVNVAEKVVEEIHEIYIDPKVLPGNSYIEVQWPDKIFKALYLDMQTTNLASIDSVNYSEHQWNLSIVDGKYIKVINFEKLHIPVTYNIILKDSSWNNILYSFTTKVWSVILDISPKTAKGLSDRVIQAIKDWKLDDEIVQGLLADSNSAIHISNIEAEAILDWIISQRDLIDLMPKVNGWDFLDIIDHTASWKFAYIWKTKWSYLVELSNWKVINFKNAYFAMPESKSVLQLISTWWSSWFIKWKDKAGNTILVPKWSYEYNIDYLWKKTTQKWEIYFKIRKPNGRIKNVMTWEIDQVVKETYELNKQIEEANRILKQQEEERKREAAETKRKEDEARMKLKKEADKMWIWKPVEELIIDIKNIWKVVDKELEKQSLEETKQLIKQEAEKQKRVEEEKIKQKIEAKKKEEEKQAKKLKEDQNLIRQKAEEKRQAELERQRRIKQEKIRKQELIKEEETKKVELLNGPIVIPDKLDISNIKPDINQHKNKNYDWENQNTVKIIEKERKKNKPKVRKKPTPIKEKIIRWINNVKEFFEPSTTMYNDFFIEPNKELLNWLWRVWVNTVSSVKQWKNKMKEAYNWYNNWKYDIDESLIRIFNWALEILASPVSWTLQEWQKQVWKMLPDDFKTYISSKVNPTKQDVIIWYNNQSESQRRELDNILEWVWALWWAFALKTLKWWKSIDNLKVDELESKIKEKVDTIVEKPKRINKHIDEILKDASLNEKKLVNIRFNKMIKGLPEKEKLPSVNYLVN